MHATTPDPPDLLIGRYIKLYLTSYKQREKSVDFSLSVSSNSSPKPVDSRKMPRKRRVAGAAPASAVPH